MNTLNILILAPHLEYPVMNGADILISKRIEGINSSFDKITVISTHWIEEFTHGNLTLKIRMDNKPRSKLLSAFLVLFTKRSYLFEKFLTINYRRNVKKYLKKYNYSVIYYSFLYSAYAFKNEFDINNNVVHLIETHNNDIEWFLNIRDYSNNFISKIIAQLSISFTKSFLLKYCGQYQFIALTKNDADKYQEFFSEERVWIIPPGCTLPNIEARTNNSDSVKLIFIGSLGIKSNEDALKNFEVNFFPFLHSRFGNRLKIVIVGANPGRMIMNICSNNNWALMANLTKEELTKQYIDADFSVLPFAYATGFKIKMLESFAHGVPVLCTKILEDQLDLSPYKQCGIFSNDPTKWCDYIEQISNVDDRESIRNSILKIAKDYTWENTNKIFINKISNFLEKRE